MRASDNGIAKKLRLTQLVDSRSDPRNRGVGSPPMSNQSTALELRGREARGRLSPTLTIASGRHHTSETILRAWFEGKSEHTIRAYERDLEAFAQFFSLAMAIKPSMPVGVALDKFFKQSAPSAHEVALAFRNFLASANLATSTINRHLATLRSITRLARMLGAATWSLEVAGLRGERRRATAGPSLDVLRAMLAVTAGDSERETRNAAILMTFFCLGLRVSELCGLTMEDTDLTSGTTWIRGKGRREREMVPVPAELADAIRRYLTYRGTTAGPLFQTLGNRGKARSGALETRSVLRIVRELGIAVGQHVWNHGLRHLSITQAVELGQKAGFGLEKIRAHSRHKSITTLLVYVDEHDKAGTQRALASLVASRLRGDR
jgi:integrase/recombinase XerC